MSPGNPRPAAPTPSPPARARPGAAPPPAHPPRIHAARAALLLVALALLAGCRGTAGPTAAEQADAARLRAALYNYADYFSAAVSGTADEIANASDDTVVREMTLRWKLRLIPTMQDAVLAEDPREGLLDAWMICIQMHDYLTTGQGQDVFGAQQQRAVDVAADLERRLLAVAERFVPENQLERARAEIRDFAAGYPITGRFATALVRATDELDDDEHPGLSAVLSIPISGIPESAQAIDRLARVAGAFTEVAADLPERSRWQAELVLLEIERLEAVVAALEDFRRLSVGLDAMVATAEGLPAALREELVVALAASEEPLASIQTTAGDVRATVSETRVVLAEARETLGALDGTVDTLATELEGTAAAWEATAHAVEDVLDKVEGLSADEGAPDDGVDLAEVSRVAEQVRDAAVELRGLLDDVESERLATALADVGRTSEAQIDHAAERAAALVTSATWSAAGLIVLLLGGLGLLRWLGSRGA